MARCGWITFIGVGLFSLCLFQSALADVEAEQAQRNALAVQVAILQAREHLHNGDPARAVLVLEKNLSRIDGNRKYLMLLRQSYISHITNLHLKEDAEGAEKFIRRLRILDPEEAKKLAFRPTSGLTTVSSVTQENTGENKLTGNRLNQEPIPQPVPKMELTQNQNDNAPLKPTFRGVMPEQEDPFRLENSLDAKDGSADNNRLAKNLLVMARAKFGQKNYEEAQSLFRKANRLGEMSKAEKTEWAYCKLYQVTRDLNSNEKTIPLEKMEAEVKSAIVMAPELSRVGHSLLSQIAKEQLSRRKQPSFQPVAVRHNPQDMNGWQVAETQHFRIFHRQARQFVEKVAQVAEATRKRMYRKWFNAEGIWRRKCDIFLHANGNDYSKQTGVPRNSPGHSRIESNSSDGQVVSRRIDLRCDNPDLLHAVLPHETTHVVLAGQFGEHMVPRWVDEGIAVLSEPPSKVNVHKRNLTRISRQGDLFHVRELIEMNDYPKADRIGAFYAQSVSLVDFLTNQRDPRTFTKFVHEGMDKGFLLALQRHYGFQSYSALQNSWSQMVQGPDSQSAGLARK